MSATPLSPDQQRLVLDHQPFARKAARYYGRRYRRLLAREDVEQLVQLALTEAARTFEPARGISFPTFAWSRVTGAMSDAVRREKRTPLSLTANLAGGLELEDGEVDFEATDTEVEARFRELTKRLTAGALLAVAEGNAGAEGGGKFAEETTGGPEFDAELRELRGQLKEAAASLPERGRRVLELYYGEQRSLREVAVELGVSYATVRRDHDEALAHVRAICRRDSRT